MSVNCWWKTVHRLFIDTNCGSSKLMINHRHFQIAIGISSKTKCPHSHILTESCTLCQRGAFPHCYCSSSVACSVTYGTKLTIDCRKICNIFDFTQRFLKGHFEVYNFCHLVSCLQPKYPHLNTTAIPLTVLTSYCGRKLCNSRKVRELPHCLQLSWS